MSKENREKQLTSEEEKLLMMLNNHSVNEINSDVTEDDIIYKDIQNITEQYNPRKFRRLLRTLEDKGYLEETGFKMVVFCPHCGSIDLNTKYACTRCKSPNISRKDFIEHTHCGYMEEKSKFLSELRYICPKCGIDLGSIDEEPAESGKKSYKVIGSSFVCNDCGYALERPNIIHICQSCGSEFGFKQSRYERLSSYRKTAKAVEMSPTSIVQDVKDTVKEILQDHDYKVELDAKLMGQSEGDHQFDILARSKSNLLIADISVNGNTEDLISLFGKKVDVYAREQMPLFSFIIDVSVNGMAKSLGDVYDIMILKADEELEERFDEYLGDVSEIEATEVEIERRRFKVLE